MKVVESFEIGGKHEFADGVVRLNWAAFYSEYVATCKQPFSKGLDLPLAMRPRPRFRVSRLIS